MQKNVYYPFEVIDFNDTAIKAGACESCVGSMRQTYHTGVEKAWQELPAIFGLPSWEVLRYEVEHDDLEERVPVGMLEERSYSEEHVVEVPHESNLLVPAAPGI